MTGHGGGRARPLLVGAGIVALVVTHVAALYYGASRVRLPAVIIGGVIGIIVIRHLGLVGLVRSMLRGRRGERKESP